jgi:LL-diaminopimelate aminotransferase
MEAAVQAMELPSGWIQQRNEVYRQRRDVLHAGLVPCGFEVGLPTAAIYLWAKTPGNMPCEEFSRQLLKRTAVSIAPGTVFGPGGEGYVRFSLTQPEARLKEAVERIGAVDWV